MKNLINISSKIGMLFTIVITIFYTSCQNTGDLNLEPKSQMITNPKYNIRTIGTQEINNNIALTRFLSEITNLKASEFNTYGRLVTYDNFNIVINDDYANYLEKPDGSYHSYTFKAVDLDFPDKKKNLILSLKDDGTYRELLLNYYLTEQDFLTYSETGNIDFDTKIVSTLIDEDSYSIDIYSKTLGPTTDTPDCLSFIFDGTTCSGNFQHTWEQRFECDIYLAEQNGGNPTGTPPSQGPLIGIHIDSNCLNGGGTTVDNSPTGYEDSGNDGSSNGGGGDTSENDNDSDYDPTDSDIHGNTVLAPILDDIGIPELEVQLNDILDNNDSYFFNSTLTEEETISFDSVSDFENYLDNLENNFSLESTEIIENPDSTKITKYKGKFNLPIPVYLNVHIKTNLDNILTPETDEFDLLEVISFETGITPFLEWEQDSYEESVSGNEATIVVNGHFNIGINVSGFDISYSDSYIVTVSLDTQTGAAISMNVIGDN